MTEIDYHHPQLTKEKIEKLIITRKLKQAKRALEEAQEALGKVQQAHDAMDPTIELEFGTFDPEPTIQVGGYDEATFFGRKLERCGCVIGYDRSWKCKLHTTDFIEQ